MVQTHTSWIMEPVKRGLAVPGADTRALVSSSRVRNARTQQRRHHPSPDARARELHVAPSFLAKMPASIMPATATARDVVGAGRQVNPRPHTAGDSNLRHGVRAVAIAATQPHVHTFDFRVADAREMVVRLGTPTPDRARADLLLNGHRSNTRARPRAVELEPQLLDLTYASISRDGRSWADAARPATAPSKGYAIIHERGHAQAFLENLGPAFGANPEQDRLKATVYQGAEPGIVTHKREWRATFGQTNSLRPELLTPTAAQLEHLLYRTSSTFDGGLAFTRSIRAQRPQTASPASGAASQQAPLRSPVRTGGALPRFRVGGGNNALSFDAALNASLDRPMEVARPSTASPGGRASPAVWQ